ncbi:MAG: SPFH/Band 7/PHB domain protein [Candidatus Viridilinea halotolerans]|uniref:SPFH/Band 7/PHB domain protein n=1 Tax=Candidatus Viridilinea halotolerans TaxID=2491704 RepID=A0A426U2I1_9CHLR|nr:MAG: SPFH/Band 7/PHB domain protein [Candidatus Viridilinea halotolerans]
MVDFGIFVTTAMTTFIICFVLIPILLGFVRLFGIYAIVNEGTCHVYTLFGKVIGVLSEPGLYILPIQLGPQAFIIHFFGRCNVLDMRLDQRYLRSQPVNSEEGAPMGIGVWYEMRICDPVSYLFKNADPQGSLAANVSNTVVRTLSNMPLNEMLEDRHPMSQAVRAEVSPKSSEWGYSLGSVYIRKVHFRDIEMTRQIEAKVVNRLRQVTSAILQDGANQVSIITNTAERQAAIEFARAQAIRPQILGQALRQIGADKEVADALFSILEIQNLAESEALVTLIPEGKELLPQLLAATEEKGK